LDSVTAMPSYKDRVRDIFEWIQLFGEQETDTITPAQIRAQRDKWLTVGPRTRTRGKERIVEHKPLAASSVNHRLRALENLFTVLWPGTPNPVRHVPEAEEPESLPRALSSELVDALFATLPAGKTTARLHVLRWTGLPAKTLMRLKAADVNLEAGVIYVPGRKKGKGSPSIVLPLLPDAVRAFQEVIAMRAWGEFSTSAMHSLVQRACAKAKLPKISPYQLRHTFATNFLAATKDLRSTQRALNHATLKTTLKYASAAVDPVLAAAFATMADAQKGGNFR
jgi:integrase